ncbi:MAG TPA: hypothetical protein VKG82_06650 [Solirubrobacteraceae bacterium]|nr:hypothetical protein [Solirubrobacteraceae bacterium]
MPDEHIKPAAAEPPTAATVHPNGHTLKGAPPRAHPDERRQAGKRASGRPRARQDSIADA